MKRTTFNKRRLERKGAGVSGLIATTLVVIMLVAIVGVGFYVYDRMTGVPSVGQAYSVVDSNGVVVAESPTAPNNCGTNKDSTITFTQTNKLNTTGAEPVNSTCYVYTVDPTGAEVYATTITNTDGGTYAGVCNQKYRMYCVSTDSNGGDSGQIQSVDGTNLKILTVKDAEERDVSGAGIEFTTNSPKFGVTWKGKQHATLQFRAKDMLADALMYDDSDISTQEYETDGVNFSSSTGNTTALAVGAGGKVHVRQEIQATDVDTDFSDFGFYVVVNAGTTVWDGATASAKFEGDSLTNLKGNLDTDENLLLDGYEYIYFVPSSILQDSVYFEFSIKALSGVNPGVADDIEIDYISKGAVLSIGGTSAGVKWSASTDASSRSAIFAVQDTNIAVS